MNPKANTLLALILATGMTNTALAECQGGENTAIPAATPIEGFFDFNNGQVLHRPTQLIWMRCAIGQVWTGGGCSGEPELLNWAAALNAATDAGLDGHSDWRLPNRNELNSIVESRCYDPAINGSIFPDTPNQGFWTASPAAADTAWNLDFDQGELILRPTGETAAVRLVRGGRL